jgi:hypothetical protein
MLIMRRTIFPDIDCFLVDIIEIDSIHRDIGLLLLTT